MWGNKRKRKKGYLVKTKKNMLNNPYNQTNKFFFENKLLCLSVDFFKSFEYGKTNPAYGQHSALSYVSD